MALLLIMFCVCVFVCEITAGTLEEILDLYFHQHFVPGECYVLYIMKAKNLIYKTNTERHSSLLQ